MIQALLLGLVLYGMLAGTLPAPVPELLAGAAAILCLLTVHHSHGTVLTIDRYAGRSAFRCASVGEKLLFCLALLCLCLCARTVWQPLALAAALAILTILGGRSIRLTQYLALLQAPLLFLLLSALTLLWRPAASVQGTFLALPWPGGFLAVTEASQAMARLVTARAMGAVSCLYFLSLSTPLPELLGALRRLHLPGAVTDLAFLMYRYIFILLDAVRNMQCAARSRLGYDGFRRSIRTTGLVYGGLLAKSFRSARLHFQAMESRCAATPLRFADNTGRKTPPLLRVGMAAFVCLFAVLIFAT